MVKSLDKKWKEIVFSVSGFGPNFLMVLMGAYYSDAVNPAGLSGNISGQTIAGNICLVLPALMSVLMIVAKTFDGVIDIPFAAITDNLSTRWGRRRPPIAVAFIPMVVSFALCWIPVFGTGEAAQLANTIWFIFWAMCFYAAYTMCLIAFYGSLSNVCSDESQRLRVSSYKAFFDTISYCIAYALVPLILQAFYKNNPDFGIDNFVFACMPLMLTMLIPLFMIKEGEKYGYPENDGKEVGETIKLGESFRITFQNKSFMNWLIVNCIAFFGLQMFLVAMNAMILGGMGMNGTGMAILNTCAFAPVPIMLYLFNKLKAKKGIRFAYQTCLLSFAFAIMSFFLGSTYVCGTDNKMLQYIIGAVGGVMGSWAIGSFFMMPYMVPAQISSVEEKLTKKNHSAMYFAAQAFTSSVVGAIASYGVYDILKNVFVSRDLTSFTWAKATEELSAIEVAAERLELASGDVFNFGVMIVPFIVAIVCVAGFFLAFRMPKDYTPENVAKELKRDNPDLDISSVCDDAPVVNDGENIFVQIALWVLSGSLFGMIWAAIALNSIKALNGEKKTPWKWLLCCLIPFASCFIVPGLMKKLKARKAETVICTALCVMFPVLFVNIVVLAILQKKINKALAEQ